MNANLASAADLLHVQRERVADLPHEGVELWLPLISKLFDLVVQFGGGVLDLFEPSSQSINLLLPLLILPNHTSVTLMHKLQSRFLAFDFVFELLCRLTRG